MTLLGQCFDYTLHLTSFIAFFGGFFFSYLIVGGFVHGAWDFFSFFVYVLVCDTNSSYCIWCCIFFFFFCFLVLQCVLSSFDLSLIGVLSGLGVTGLLILMDEIFTSILDVLLNTTYVLDCWCLYLDVCF